MRPILAPILLKPLQRRVSMRASSPTITVKPLSSDSSSSSSNDEDDQHHDESDSDNRRDAEEDKSSAERIYARKGACNVPLWLAAGNKERDDGDEDATAEIVEIATPDEFEAVDGGAVPVATEEDEDERSADCIIVGVYSPPKIAKSPPRRMKSPTFLKRKSRRHLRLDEISPGDHNPPDEKPKQVARVRRESRSKKRKNSLDADVVWPALSAPSSAGSNKREKTAKMKQKTALQKPSVSTKTHQAPKLPLNLARNSDGDEQGENRAIDTLLDPLSITDDGIKCIVHSDSDDGGDDVVEKEDGSGEEDAGVVGGGDSSQYDEGDDNAGVFEDHEFAFPSCCNEDDANRQQQELKRSYEIAYSSRNGIRPSQLARTELAGYLQQLATMHSNAEMQTQRWHEPTLRVFLENTKVDVGPRVASTNYEFAGSIRRSDFDRVGAHFPIFGQDDFGQWIVIDLKIWVSLFFLYFRN